MAENELVVFWVRSRAAVFAWSGESVSICKTPQGGGPEGFISQILTAFPAN